MTRKVNERREELKALSIELRPLVKGGEYSSINAALVNKIYKDANNTEFKTFKQWKREGRTVKRGAKSFPVWGQPIEATTEEEELFEFFPICHLFSNCQVREGLAEYHTSVSEITVSYSPTNKASTLPQVCSPEECEKLFREMWDTQTLDYKESAYLMLLNRDNKVLGYSLLSVGGISGTVIDPKIVFQIALKTNASSIVLAHNHPSGNLTPSAEDKDLTKRIKEVGNFLKLRLVDHLILTSEGFYSFANEGLI